MHRLEICNKSLLYQSIHWNRLLRYEIRKQISSISTHQSTWLGINLFLNMTTDVKWYYLTWAWNNFFFIFVCASPISSVFILFHFFHLSFKQYILSFFSYSLEWDIWSIQMTYTKISILLDLSLSASMNWPICTWWLLPSDWVNIHFILFIK